VSDTLTARKRDLPTSLRGQLALSLSFKYCRVERAVTSLSVDWRYFHLTVRRMLVNTTELETQDQGLDLDLPLVADDDSAVAAGGSWVDNN
jgi:hypothetical protein